MSRHEGAAATVGAGTVELTNITKTFSSGSILAVDDISLDISPDEFVVLLGPSGCGKTTTLRCIAGLEIPDSGRVFIGGADVTRAKPKDRDIAFVFQTIALFPHMNVRKNISFGLDMKTDLPDEEIDARVEEAADLLGIADLLDRSPTELSGGQQQRVSLGRAMVMEPAAFLLDEPFSALDANLRDQMQTEIKKLQRELQTAMVFVTHDQEEAMTLGDRIVIMEEGRILQVDSPHQVYNEPTNRFVAEFIGSPSTNFLECDIDAGDGGITLSTDFFDHPVSGEHADRLRGHVGEHATIGIRPEYLELDGEDPLFSATVTLVEPQGSRDTIHLEADGHTFRATTFQGQIENEDVTVEVGLRTDRFWVFDGDGERII